MAGPKGTRPPVVVNSVFELVIEGTQAAGGSSVTPSINRFYYQATGGPAAVMSAFVTAFIAGPLATLALAANVRWAANQIKARLVNDATSAATETTSAVVGAIATAALPSETDVVVNLYTGARGRSGRGFKHLGGVSVADVTGDILTGAGLTRWQAVRDAFKNTITDANGTIYTPFLLSPSWSTVNKNPTALYGYNVTSAKVNETISKMKKRKAKSILS